MLSSQCAVGAPVCSARDSMYLRMTLFLFKALYIHLIYPSVESDATDGLIYTFIADRNNNDSTKNT